MSVSQHPHPQATTQRLIGIILTLGIAGLVVGGVGLLLMGILLGLPLMILAIPFFIALGIPLLLQTSLHPTIIVEENGIRLYPLVWRATFLRWEDIDYIRNHSLLKPPPPTRLARKGVLLHEGMMIVTPRQALPWHYHWIGLMVGDGFQHPMFAISNRTHVDYEILRETIKKHARRNKTA